MLRGGTTAAVIAAVRMMMMKMMAEAHASRRPLGKREGSGVAGLVGVELTAQSRRQQVGSFMMRAWLLIGRFARLCQAKLRGPGGWDSWGSWRRGVLTPVVR